MAILVVAFSLSGCAAVLEKYFTPVDPESTEELVVEIPSGSTTTTIGTVLFDEGLIQNVNAFKAKVRLMEVDGKMMAGTYKLSPSMDVETIVEKLVSGETYVETFKITIPEGYEVRQIVDLLASKNQIDPDAFIEVLKTHPFDYKFLEGVDRSNLLEGFLFPDTYEFKKGATEVEIVTRMLNRFDSVFQEAYYVRSEELNMTVEELVTLASIVEREAMVDSEFKLVSSVFHNRIKKEWLLESCATVQYVLQERKPVLSIADTEIESPYNTYLNVGLPPAPIASPGKRALEAALYPEETSYLFFVTKETNDGSHYFNETYEEHLRDARRSN
jgi:UPF0755 protein